ncbi:MAG: TRIC cation channel family protein [Acidimicrobiales bacterium]|nr:TRIC cation channel family protein [Acidimicrobiales bacterium]
MATGLLSASALQWIDQLGVLVFALSGASLAARKRFDIVGVGVLAGATGLGGGMVRDVLLGDTPPLALRSVAFMILPAAATLIVMAAHGWVLRVERIVLMFDAAGLGLFAVTGATRTLERGNGWWAAILLGTMSAVGGGVIRDVLARDVPVIFRADSELYAIPAALTAAAATLCWHLRALDAIVAGAIICVAFTLRLLAIRHAWTAPTPRDRMV